MGRRDAARRRLAGAGGYTLDHSDSQLDLNQNGFPPGTTVDELRWYSRRRNNDSTQTTNSMVERRQDNLQPESGTLKDVSSEYRRCFQAPPQASHSLGDLTENSNEPKRSLRRYSSHSEDMFNKAENDKWLQRCRRQNIKLEGDMLFRTENADAFIEYVLSQRPDLLRRKTHLRLEGEMDTTTESHDKFVLYDRVERPPLMKRSTNLHLEGDHLLMPEYKELFVEFPRKRPTMTKPLDEWLRTEGRVGAMPSETETLSRFGPLIGGSKADPIVKAPSLKCEGSLSLVPEYKENFKPHQAAEKQTSIRQQPSLKVEGELHARPEYRESFREYPALEKQPAMKQQAVLKLEGELNAVPEYRENYRQYSSIEKQPAMKPRATLKPEGELSAVPVYKESFGQFSSLEKQHVLKPPEHKESSREYTAVTEKHFPEYKPALRDRPEFSDPRDKQYAPFPPVRIKRVRQPDTRFLFEDEPIHASGVVDVSADRSRASMSRKLPPATPPRAVSPSFGGRLPPKQDIKSPTGRRTEERLATRPPRSTAVGHRRGAAWSPTTASQQQGGKTGAQNKEQKTHVGNQEDFSPRYNIYGTHKQQAMRQPEVLSSALEGQPEYRKAYLDYLIRERPKRLNDDQENVKLHEEEPRKEHKPSEAEEKSSKMADNNLAVYQPSVRRGSSSNHSSPRRRSASPAYRMNVTNVDEPKKGFGAKPPQPPPRDTRHAKRGTSPAGYPAQRESVPNDPPRVSTRSNWIKNTAHHGSIEQHNENNNQLRRASRDKPSSFVVLDTIGADVQKLRQKWESPWWQNSY